VTGDSMNIVKATRRYEDWLGGYTRLVKPDLKLKHERMAEASFPFMRATFYRWMQIWPEVCRDLAKAPEVLAVGDLHVENFGTWRDTEGRLVWGVNDFDEAAQLPYTVDLVRLATSAVLAFEQGHLTLKAKDACAAILDGYNKSYSARGRPFVLEEDNRWLRQLATGELRDPEHFWEKMDNLPKVTGEVPASAKEALEHLLPERNRDYRLVRRVAGLGSLGHVRLVAIVECDGGRVAREVKALAPSAVRWARGDEGPAELLYQAILGRAVRCPDPFVQLRGQWLVRRLSPSCSRIELTVLPKDRDELRLLFAMGWEAANIHLGSPDATKQVRRHLGALPANWLIAAAKNMAKAVTQDWEGWRKAGKP
jgi:uncharacterized protein (DUF2252 family)